MKKILSFIRWRIVLLRYLTMLRDLRWGSIGQAPPYLLKETRLIEDFGYCDGPRMVGELLHHATEIYCPRALDVVASAAGHTFESLFISEDIKSSNPVFAFAFSPEILERAADYFHGKLVLDSIQVLYSWPTEGDLRESQHWHLDYADRKSLHCVAYLNDVFSEDGGPFAFINKADSADVGRSLTIRRLTDAEMFKRVEPSKRKIFVGEAGASILIDPAACYHYGSRCVVPRLAVFITFSSWFPFVQPTDFVKVNARTIRMAAAEARPDLSAEFLDRLILTNNK